MSSHLSSVEESCDDFTSDFAEQASEVAWRAFEAYKDTCRDLEQADDDEEAEDHLEYLKSTVNELVLEISATLEHLGDDLVARAEDAWKTRLKTSCEPKVTDQALPEAGDEDSDSTSYDL